MPIKMLYIIVPDFAAILIRFFYFSSDSSTFSSVYSWQERS